ncbi:Nn.00g065710.m01.CDS01 [Neocucurbitaria sp. VM-36]
MAVRTFELAAPRIPACSPLSAVRYPALLVVAGELNSPAACRRAPYAWELGCLFLLHARNLDRKPGIETTSP